LPGLALTSFCKGGLSRLWELRSALPQASWILPFACNSALRARSRQQEVPMRDKLKVDYTDRLSAAADAKRALVAKLKPKPTVTDPDFDKREAMRAQELEAVRKARAEAREAARQRVVAAQESALEAKRAERKERKALTKAEQKARRDAKYAARKARQR